MKTLLLALSILASTPEETSTEPPEAYLALAQMMIGSGDVDLARKVLRDGAKLHPNAPGFHLLMGETHAAKGEHALAFYEFQWELLKGDPEHPVSIEAATRSAEMMRATGKDAAEIRAVVEAMQVGVDDPARASAKVAAIREKRNAFVLVVYEAEWAAAAGDRDAAKALFRDVLRRDPGFVPAYVGLAALVDEAEAKRLLHKARTIDPKHWSLR